MRRIRTRQLEREQRVPARQSRHLDQLTPREPHAESLPEQPLQLLGAQRTDLNRAQTREGTRKHKRFGLVGAVRHQETDRLRAQPAGSERDERRRRAVEPLRVVDGHQDRRCARKRLEDREEACGDRVMPARICLWYRTQERELERILLWARQLLERRGRHLSEQVAQSDIGQRHLRPGRPRRQDTPRVPRCTTNRLLPKRCLPDPGHARDHDRPKSVSRCTEQAREFGELVFSTNQSSHRPILASTVQPKRRRMFVSQVSDYATMRESNTRANSNQLSRVHERCGNYRLLARSRPLASGDKP